MRKWRKKLRLHAQIHTVAEWNLTLFVSLVLRNEWKHIYIHIHTYKRQNSLLVEGKKVISCARNTMNRKGFDEYRWNDAWSNGMNASSRQESWSLLSDEGAGGKWRSSRSLFAPLNDVEASLPIVKKRWLNWQIAIDIVLDIMTDLINSAVLIKTRDNLFMYRYSHVAYYIVIKFDSNMYFLSQ